MRSIVLETHLVTGKYLFAIQIHPLDLFVLQTPPLPDVDQFAAFRLEFSSGVLDGRFLRSLCLPAPLKVILHLVCCHVLLPVSDHCKWRQVVPGIIVLFFIQNNSW